jgi:N-acetylglucosamine kinase-like BadF-type ATPase
MVILTHHELLTFHSVAGVCLDLSGVDRPDDKKEVSGWIKDILCEHDGLNNVLENGLLIHNDGVTAMSSGTFGVLNDSMVIISGTGSICIATANGEEFVRTGGWG